MTTRRVRRFPPRRTKWLLGALLVLVPVLAPIDAPDLPAPLDTFAGASRVLAQSSSITRTGVPDPCPPGLQSDTSDESLCVLEAKACPENPLRPGEYLEPSTGFSRLCEKTVNFRTGRHDVDDFDKCHNLKGFLTKRNGFKTQATIGGSMVDILVYSPSCRITSLSSCPSGLTLTDTKDADNHDICRRIKRRAWSCPLGIPVNTWLSCYEAPPALNGPHPACGAGAPSLVVLDCENYVGQDYVRTNPPPDCSSYKTGYDTTLPDPPTKIYDVNTALSSPGTDTSSKYWCSYNSSYLDSKCHDTSATCPILTSLCIKRASRSGGCNTIANTIRCRSLQADHSADSTHVTVEYVYKAGCTPCTPLPFESWPADCPDVNSVQLATPSDHVNYLNLVHEVGYDVAIGQLICNKVVNGTANSTDHRNCRNTIFRCTDPPRGWLTKTTTHTSGQVIIGSTVILDVEGVPNTETVITIPSLDSSGLRLNDRTYIGYPNDPPTHLWGLVNSSRRHGTLFNLLRQGECRIEARPLFRVTVEELWFDDVDDVDDITDLFGNSALNWWNNDLTDQERDDLTRSRGLEPLAGLSGTDLSDEIERRAQLLTQNIDCNYGERIWCRWTPSRSGYYQLTAKGAWYMYRWGAPSGYVGDTRRNTIGGILQVATPIDHTPCTLTTAQERIKDRDCILEDLQNARLTPEAAGLADDLSQPLPRPADPEWSYSDQAGESVRCPSRNFLFRCIGAAGHATNYTETEPIGIMVLEVRTGSVTPSR